MYYQFQPDVVGAGIVFFTWSGVLNFPESKPIAESITRTTIAMNIKPIKHISNLSVYTYLAKYLIYLADLFN